jgi:hypothetical protein
MTVNPLQISVENSVDLRQPLRRSLFRACSCGELLRSYKPALVE